MADESFSQADRVKSTRDFERVFKRGFVVADDVLVVHFFNANHDKPRLGISISKRVGNSPHRNRWKRLIRESFRKQKHAFPALEFIVRPKKGATPDYHRIYASLGNIAKRAARKISR